MNIETVSINFHCYNDAFDDSASVEIARILRDLAQKIESGDIEKGNRKVYDLNGNAVGEIVLA